MKRLIWTLVIGLVVVILGGVCLHHLATETRGTDADTTTVTVVDTITYYYPVPKDSVVTRWVTRTLAVARPAPEAQATVADTVWNAVVLDADSANVLVPIEHKVYEDSTCKAWVSGYMVSLDSLHTFNRTITTTIRDREAKPPNRWGIGVTAGYGYGKQGFTPFVGIGITYNLIDLRRSRRQR